MTRNQPLHTTGHKKWLDELILELRLNDVSGKSIGDTVASVEEFLADSGQSPLEAFGTPRHYASQLAAAQPASKSGQAAAATSRTSMALSTTSLVAFLVLSAALTPWLGGGQLLLGRWQLVMMAALAALVLALPLYLPWLLRHSWALFTLPLVGGAAGVLGAMLTPKNGTDALLVLDPGIVIMVSGAALVALSAWGSVRVLREHPDVIENPLDAKAGKRSRWFEMLTAWLFPILALVLLGFTALVAGGS